MTKTRIAVVGSGQRVREAALPVLASLEDRFELAGVFSRKPKTIRAGDRDHEVAPLDALDASAVAELDALYLVVSKPAVPSVLARLAALRPRGVHLLVETPVVLPRHLPKARSMRAFGAVSVTEDCVTLPLVDAVREAVEAGAIGALRTATLDRSAYAYHGVAMLKALVGAARVRRARRVPSTGGGWSRTYRFANGAEGRTVDPRDYAVGTLTVAGTGGVLVDHDVDAGHARNVEVERSGDRAVAVRAGDARRALSEPEQELMGTPLEGSDPRRPWSWMDGMKRVGFRRLLERVADGGAAYPVLDALDDALVDYHLEKLGRYAPNPLTSARGLGLRPFVPR
ncbi:MAG: hypothetical protein AAFP22_17610 [Planctomycetota bacterium]